MVIAEAVILMSWDSSLVAEVPSQWTLSVLIAGREVESDPSLTQHPHFAVKPIVEVGEQGIVELHRRSEGM